eukprot:TRINITY_DN30179_c0_g1_i1.p1 TRINITY_DN30179_c0_g1~~TRINITY_DN30179_c0_g1_i1.p1  ORF type:complete len:279 (+),score=69.40 TRINITY_DN30179_c0_g1_i1:160-996(+)
MVTYHPELDPWVSPPVLVLTPFLYAACIYGLREAMRPRRAFALVWVRQVYNAIQVGWSVLTAVMIARHWSPWNPFMINVPFAPDLEWWLFLHYVGKYYDLGETVIIVLRKRGEQLTLMHLYHHSSMLCILGWLLHMGYANGTAAFGAFANSVVHALMFGHLYSEGGSKCMVSVINRYTVTLLQLLQFVAIIVHAVLAVLFEQIIPWWACTVQLLYGTSLVVLFLRIARNGQRARLGRDQIVAAARRSSNADETVHRLPTAARDGGPPSGGVGGKLLVG